MSEINEFRERLEIAERKIAVLEETFETLKNMRTSERMNDYINNQRRNLVLVDLINSASDNEKIDLSVQMNAVEKVMQERLHLENQIANAISKSYAEPQYDVTSSFNYREYEDGIEITQYNGFDEKNVVIPNKINGMDVIKIGNEVFKNGSFKTIILPNNLKEIGNSAFFNCKSLRIIDLPKSLIQIGHSAFQNSVIETINFSECLQEIKNDSFNNCQNLKSISLPKSLVHIGEGAFGSTGLTYVFIDTEKISSFCFSKCSKLSTCVIGENVKKICSHAFWNSGIRNIIIPENVIDLEKEAFFPPSVKHHLNIAFCGMKTNMTSGYKNCSLNGFSSQYTIYCLPGSDAQKYARNRGITVKPLSEFSNIQEV